MYHISPSKSKTKPFNLVRVTDQGEVLSSHPLTTKPNCFKNVSACLKDTFFMEHISVLVQDDTTMKVFTVVVKGNKWTKNYLPDQKPFPKYISGRNPINKKK